MVAVPQPDDQPVEVQVELKTDKAAQQLRSGLHDRFAHEPIEVAGEGSVCQLQTAFDLSRVRSILSRLLEQQGD